MYLSDPEIYPALKYINRYLNSSGQAFQLPTEAQLMNYVSKLKDPQQSESNQHVESILTSAVLETA